MIEAGCASSTAELQLPTKDTSKGLVPVAEQQGMFIAYASAPGRTASDMGDKSGPYAAALSRKRSRANPRPLGQAPWQPKWTSQTRDALIAIFEADKGLILHESMYEDGLALERLLSEIGGKRSAAIEIIRQLVRKATAAGVAPGSIGSWSYFVKSAKAEMSRVTAA